MPGGDRPVLRSVAAKGVGCLWRPHTRVCVRGDGAGWVLSREAQSLQGVAKSLGLGVLSARWAPFLHRQCVFSTDQFALLNDRYFTAENRYAVSYFHGRPGQGVAEFDRCHAQLKRFKNHIWRVHVSHRAMERVVCESGIAPERVRRIPIAVDCDLFASSHWKRDTLRQSLGIPESAVVIGSFQKDGVGWGDGLEPKLIKGPDILVRVLARLRARLPELFVLLSGPARGYVRRELDKAGVPYRHLDLPSYEAVAGLYRALDLYLVTSREEGGPKAVLESMASGVPLISTRVGQATELVEHGRNGWLVDVGDEDALVAQAEWVLGHPAEVEPVKTAGRATAAQNTYAAQRPLWREFFAGFVEP